MPTSHHQRGTRPRLTTRTLAGLALLTSTFLAGCSEPTITGVWKCDIPRLRSEVNAEVATQPADQQPAVRYMLSMQLSSIEDARWVIRENNRYESVTGPFDNKIRAHGKWERTTLQGGEARVTMTTTHVDGQPRAGTQQWRHEGDRLLQIGEDQLPIVLQRIGPVPADDPQR